MHKYYKRYTKNETNDVILFITYSYFELNEKMVSNNIIYIMFV